MLKALFSGIWNTLFTSTKSWWSTLDNRDKIIYVIIAIGVGIVWYQHNKINHTQQEMAKLQVQISSMATKHQLDRVDVNIANVQTEMEKIRSETNKIRHDTQTAINNLSKPFTSTGMAPNEIVESFKDLNRATN